MPDGEVYKGKQEKKEKRNKQTTTKKTLRANTNRESRKRKNFVPQPQPRVSKGIEPI